MNSRSFSRLFSFALCIAFLSLAGCQLPLKFPTPGPQWQTNVGQLQYVTPQRSVIGETVVSRFDKADFQLDFVAGPGVPLMRFRQSETGARAEGVFARGGWQGAPARVPHRLQSWAALRQVFASLEAKHDLHRVTVESRDGTWTAYAEQAGAQPRRVRIEFPKTGERFVFVFGS